MDAIFAFPYLLLAIVIAFLLQNSRRRRRADGGDRDHGHLRAAVLPRRPRTPCCQLREEPYVEAAPGARRAAANDHAALRLRQRDPVGAGHRHAQRRRRHPHPCRTVVSLASASSRRSAAEWGYDISAWRRRRGCRVLVDRRFPGLAIVLLVTGLTLVGEGLNESSTRCFAGQIWTPGTHCRVETRLPAITVDSEAHRCGR